MANLTIHDLPDDLLQRIETVAATKGHTIEQEVLEMLEVRFAARSRIIQRIQERWKTLPTTSTDEIEHWRTLGRP
jgi:hypothetical protein